MWNLKPFRIHTLCSQEKSYVFQCEILNPLVYILYVPKKKVVFLMWVNHRVGFDNYGCKTQKI